MFNTINQSNSQTNNNSQSMKISAVSGNLFKTHPKSWFKSMHIGSPCARDFYLCEDPHLEKKGKSTWRGDYEQIEIIKTPIVVLQVMNTHDGYVMVEAVKTEDYIIDCLN